MKHEFELFIIYNLFIYTVAQPTILNITSYSNQRLELYRGLRLVVNNTLSKKHCNVYLCFGCWPRGRVVGLRLPMGMGRVRMKIPQRAQRPPEANTTLLSMSFHKVSKQRACTALQRKSHLCIPCLVIVRPQSQFPHSCVCEWFIYTQDRSTYLAAAK